MISEILAGLNILEKIGRFISRFRKSPKPKTDSVSSRFLQLFESHDVHRNQIPRFFGHGLTIKDVQDETALLNKLDESLLDAACHLFGVRREWLEGAESQIYPCHDFYKNPEDVAPFLATLKANNPDGSLDGILMAPCENSGDALIVLREIIGWIGKKAIYRSHLCNNWRFDYWKSRVYLTAFIAIAFKQGVYIRGSILPTKEIAKIAEGEALLISEEDDFSSRSGRLWYPEDMALKPESFLLGIDPENNNYGLSSALRLWLSLEENGLMGTDLSMYKKETIRGLFELELEKYKST